jgi:hypothetical protein
MSSMRVDGVGQGSELALASVDEADALPEAAPVAPPGVPAVTPLPLFTELLPTPLLGGLPPPNPLALPVEPLALSVEPLGLSVEPLAPEELESPLAPAPPKPGPAPVAQP